MKNASEHPFGFNIGPVRIDRPVLLAPMSGVTDWPFRRQAYQFGAGLVVSEMVACETLAEGREDVLRRMKADDRCGPHIIQLAGRDAKWMDVGARIAADAGADILDINMGCPAKQVTRGLSGSALMRDLDHAMSLIEAVVKAVSIPVTLKMRLGWDHDSINAPELAMRAEGAGVQMITVHGRTRQQFYKGQADWAAVAAVKEVITLPLIINGDIKDKASCLAALEASNGDGVMVGRAAQGRPWLPGSIAQSIITNTDMVEPEISTGLASLRAALIDSTTLYGESLGVRCMRKHFASFIDWAEPDLDTARIWRGRLCRTQTYDETLSALKSYDTHHQSRRVAA